jgi:hypothetical protein
VIPHVGAMVVFAALVSTVFAALHYDDPRAQMRAGLRMFGGFVLGGWLLGWIMFGLYG